MPIDPQFLAALNELAGKYVQVRVKRSKAIDAAPGEAQEGFYFTDYQGDVLNPAIKPYPEENPNGPLCLYLQTRDQQRKIYALAVESIDEVDDEVTPPAPMHVNMVGLTQP